MYIYMYKYALKTLTNVNTPFKPFVSTREYIKIFFTDSVYKKLETNSLFLS